MPRFNELYSLWIIENRRIFALGFSVVAPHTNPFIILQIGNKILQLSVQHLLRPEDVRLFPPNLLTDTFAAAFPTVPFLRILLVLVADIVAPYSQCLGRNCRRNGESKYKTD